MEYVIRPIEERDIPACTRLYNYYIRETTVSFEEEELSVDAFAARVRRISAEYPYLVAERDGQVVGYAYLDRYSERTAYRFTADLSIYVAHDCLAAGAGAARLAEVERRGRAQGIRNIVSIITGKNARSLGFHQKHGFREVGRLEQVGYKFGEWLDVIFMQKNV